MEQSLIDYTTDRYYSTILYYDNTVFPTLDDRVTESYCSDGHNMRSIADRKNRYKTSLLKILANKIARSRNFYNFIPDKDKTLKNNRRN